MSPEVNTHKDLPSGSELLIDTTFARCEENAPNFGVDRERFGNSLRSTIRKSLFDTSDTPPSEDEIREFLEQIQADDLFLALACAAGNERAWWEFDQQHRSYMERVARHLAKTETDASDVVDTVYEQLYGTKIVDGERVSKFATYSGRGSLRGWLRTVIWHSLIDLHRASHDEVSLDEMTETIGEGAAHANFAAQAEGGEDAMLDEIARNRYGKLTRAAIENAFAALDDHEKLLLLYYHVEHLKLREIARLVENEASPLRGWFQRKSKEREKDPGTRIHESTIMRWLEKSYSKVLEHFRSELKTGHNLKDEEIEICMGLATKDLAGPNLFRKLTPT